MPHPEPEVWRGGETQGAGWRTDGPAA